MRPFFRYLSAFLAVLLFWASSAAAQSRFNVTLSLADSASGDPVGFATVSISKPSGSKETVVAYALSGSEGKAVLERVKPGTYKLKVELLGYKPIERELKVEKEDVDLGLLKMVLDVEQLEAAAVSAQVTPVTVKEDTVEYNALAFKTTDTDMLEDLLKKLPGVEVEEDGTVKVNGETVTKITVEGRTFFLNDPQLATKNITAKMVHKVKAIQKKTDQAEFTGIDDGERETVLDISFRPGMGNGLFGNVNGGIGHDVRGKSNTTLVNDDGGDTRFLGGAFLGNFSKKRQLSVVLNTNNTNNEGATNTTMRSMQAARGGGGGGGITTSFVGGLNGSWMLGDNPADRSEASGNYVFNASNNVSEQTTRRISYLNDHDLLYDNERTGGSTSSGHRLGIRVNYKVSENTTLLFEPSVDYGRGSYDNDTRFRTDTRYTGRQYTSSEGFTSTNGGHDRLSTSGRFLLRQRIGIPGRTLTVGANYSLGRNVTDGYNQSLTRSFLSEDMTVYRDSLINQRFHTVGGNASVGGNVTYTEPLGNGFYLAGNYSINWGTSRSRKDTYDSGPFDRSSFYSLPVYNPVGEQADITYSNNIVNTHITQRAGINLNYQVQRKLNLQVGAGVNPTTTHNRTLRRGVESSYDSTVWNWSPQASFMYRFSESNNIRFSYRGSSSQPSVSQLMPVPDNANPMRVSFGNPYLLPSFSHSTSVNFTYANRQRMSFLNFSMGGSLVQNPVVNALWYGDGGAQYTMPVNGRNAPSVNMNATYNTPLWDTGLSVATSTNASWSSHCSYIGEGIRTDDYYSEGEFDYERFNREYGDIESTGDFSRNGTRSANLGGNLRLTYRKNALELTLGGGTNYRHSWYDIARATVHPTWNNSASFTAHYTFEQIGLTMTSRTSYRWYAGYTTQMPDQLNWYAEVGKSLFKKKGSLSLCAYDLMGQNRAISVNDQSNSHSESISKTLGRYIILRFVYQFNNRNFGGGRGGRGGFGGGRGGYGGGFGGYGGGGFPAD